MLTNFKKEINTSENYRLIHYLPSFICYDHKED